MNFGVLRPKVWYTFLNQSRCHFHGCKYFVRTSLISSRWNNSVSGRLTSGGGQISLREYFGDSWKNRILKNRTVYRACNTVPDLLLSEKTRTETKVKSISHEYSTNKGADKTNIENDGEKLTLVQKFKKLYRDYWYVLVPVHLITSIGWFGTFYYLAKSGVDVVVLLESIGLSEKYISPLKDSNAGYVALAYAMYKIATPVRYTVTLGGTTLSIKYLREYGYIKPIPPNEKLKEIYQEGKERFKERRETFIDEYRKRKQN